MAEDPVEPTEREWDDIVNFDGAWERLQAAVERYGQRIAADVRQNEHGKKCGDVLAAEPYELPIVIYAVMVDGRIRGGDNKPEIYWTQSQAKLAARRNVGDRVVRVRVSLEAKV